MGRRLVACLRLHRRKAALAALLAFALLLNGVATAGTVVAGNFGRSPAFPSTPNGRFPQETAQIIQFKQAKVMRDADVAAGRPEKTPLEYRKLAAGGIGLSALAMVGLGENAAQQSALLGQAGGALGAIGGIMCYTGYGCAVGGPLMAMGGVMYLGSLGVCLVTDCSIKTTSDGTVDGTGITGKDVQATEKKASTPNSTYLFVNEVYYGSGSTYNEHYSKYGIGRQFIVRDSQGRYRVAIMIGYTNLAAGQVRSIFGDIAFTGYYDTPKPNSTRDATTMLLCEYVNGGCSGGIFTPKGEASNCTGYVSCYIYVSESFTQSPNGQVVYEFVPVKQVPFFGLGSGAQLPPQAAAKTTSPGFMANAGNNLWQSQGQSAPVPYSDANKITNEDVEQYRQQWPERASSLGDLARPISAPGQPPKIGPIDNPESAPQQVEVTNPAQAEGSPKSSEKEEPDTELDDTPGLLGDVMQPARDFLGGDFAKFMTPGITLPAARCPVFTIDLPTLLGREDRSAPSSSAFLCDWFTDIRPLFVGILRMMYVFAALIIVFKRS